MNDEEGERLFLAPCASRAPQTHFEQTVTTSVPEEVYSKYLGEEFEDGIRIWGVTAGKKDTWDNIQPGDYLLFYTGDLKYQYAAQVQGTDQNLGLAKEIWPDFSEQTAGSDDASDPYEYLIFLDPPFEVDIDSSDLHSYADHSQDYPISFIPLNEHGLQAIRQEFGTVVDYLQTHRKTPEVWIEKTATSGRPYKQEGKFALGKALMSPSRDKSGRKRYETLREANVGDIVLHLLQDQSGIVSVSVIDSELDESFHDPPHDRWNDEQEEQGGYLRWLSNYEGIEPHIHLFEDLLEKPEHRERLHEIRDKHDHKIFYNTHLSLNQGHYFTKCPHELVEILMEESPHLRDLLEERGYNTSQRDPKEDGYWGMVNTKREKARDFMNEPSKTAFIDLVDSDHFWGSHAYRNWPNELFEEHTPEEVAKAIEQACDTGDLSKVTHLHQMGTSKASEILRALEPDKYAILNKRSRAGMRALGFEPPANEPDVGEYAKFTDEVRSAHDQFGLRDLMEEEKAENIPEYATKLEIADWAFSENFEDRIDLEAQSVPSVYADFADELSVSFDQLSIQPGDLYFDDWERIQQRIERAISGGSHILLFGPPGTGKTKLAREICEEVIGENQYEIVTGSADWSTFDTIGGYQSTREGSLQFEPGVILQRFHTDSQGTPANEWIVIDELNRADIDKAFGALFSALTGESVTLPFEHKNGENIELLDASREEETVDPHKYYIPEDWRMISTMNTLDKTSLYEMSYAFMRRWAFIPVGIPDLPDPDVVGGRDRLADLVEEYVAVWDDNPNISKERLATIGAIWYTVNQHRAIGPAIIEDIYEYVSKSPEQDEPDYASPIVMYVFPQLEGLRRGKLKNVVDGLEEIVSESEDLRSTAEDFFQTDLSDETTD